MSNKKASFFADFLKDLEKSKIEQGKPVEEIEEKRYFLIVCEGTETEPTYFNLLKTLLPKRLLETIEVDGEGVNTINIVEIALEKRDKRIASGILPPYDEVWAVFDKDDFPKERFDNAVTLARQAGIEAGCTNEAFELWYVLHFQYLDTALKRHQYFEILAKITGVKYEKDKKSAKQIAQFVFEKGNPRSAVDWADALEAGHHGKTPSASCPYTRIHHLVRNILDYAMYEDYQNRRKQK